MLGLIFSLDYEIYGTGRGSFTSLMIEPTNRLVTLFRDYGAKVTIMAEVAEILALKKHPEFQETAGLIEAQLRAALSAGHDVQLHLHPAWFNARFQDQQWHLDFDEYCLPGLPETLVSHYVNLGKEYLERLAKDVRPDYRCVAFRAGNWLIQPSAHVVRALEEAGFLYDTSVFKMGRGNVGPFAIDFRDAQSDLFPWTVASDDINRAADRQGLREVPILTRKVLFTSMLTAKRLRLQWRLRRDSGINGRPEATDGLGSGKSVAGFRLLFPKKFDFCRSTFRELRGFLDYAVRRAEHHVATIPVVSIGHSTEFSDDGSVTRFLDYVNRRYAGEVFYTTFLGCAEMGLC
jgi:hypothetical protein